jgi:hypothetical protein
VCLVSPHPGCLSMSCCVQHGEMMIFTKGHQGFQITETV